VSAVLVEIFDVAAHQTIEMPLVEHNDMVE
jgi:hypothetical protein